MIFSNQDIELLRLLRWCGSIHPNCLCGLHSEVEIEMLIKTELVRKHTSSGTLALTGNGHLLLEGSGFSCPELVPFSYRSDLIQRRVRSANILLTAYRAFIDPYAVSSSGLSKSPTLFLPSIIRGRKKNLWGSSRIAALLHIGDLYCGAYSVYPGVGTINLEDELKTLSNCTGGTKSIRMALLFAGDTYADVLAELMQPEYGEDGRLMSYGAMWRRSPVPVHLLSCDDVGAVQLRIMSQTDYRKKLAQAGLASQYAPAPPELPSCDGMMKGLPFVIAADMDLGRLDAACTEAERAGFNGVAAAALRGQIATVLRERYRGRVKLFSITDETLKTAFGSALALRTPDRTPYVDAEGGFMDASLIQTYRKTGGSVRK